VAGRLHPAAPQNLTRPGSLFPRAVVRGRGTTFSIEFVNVQPDAEGNPANHIHCV
jgi:hypothetical protein